MNRNYNAGRRLEYARKKVWETRGYEVTRAAGSHSHWDLIAVHSERPIELIQCKRTKVQSHAEKLLKDWQRNPPLKTSKFYHQVLEVQISGSSKVESTTV